MNRTCRIFKFVAYLALLTAVPAFTQIPSPEATPDATAPAAYVYVQTRQGVDVFDAASDGALTLIKGSPFSTSGQMGGVTASHLISVGTNYLHTYTIESNGAVGKQASEIDTQKYGGSQCGPTGETSYSNGVILDHTGKYFNVQLYGATYIYNDTDYILCSAWQSYKISSNGDFTFLGDVVGQNGYHGNAFPVGISTISSNDKFAYGSEGEVYANVFSAFKRGSNGKLENNSTFKEVDPTPNPDAGEFDDAYFPIMEAADPADHMAVLMYEPFAGTDVPPQLASYTIKSDGDIISTNAWNNMPTPALEYCCGTVSMSTTGKLLAVTGYPGLQIFHFNGADPITEFSGVLLPSVNIDQVAWDNNNHLYAISYSSGELYVYTVTPTSISEVSGSPFSVPNAYGQNGLIVVPK
jgi:hypothetical protein